MQVITKKLSLIVVHFNHLRYRHMHSVVDPYAGGKLKLDLNTKQGRHTQEIGIGNPQQ